MKLADQLHIDLDMIDKEMLRIVRTDMSLPMLSTIASNIRHMILAGGKRLRPMMVMVGSRFGRMADPKKVLQMAAVTEFIHVASLIHDDVIDQADTRRGKPTLHVLTDIPTAIHTANYMMARVAELLSKMEDDRNPYREEITGLLTSRLCLGEYQQMANRFNFDLSMDTYLSKTRNKTAVLMSTCLEVGAKLGRATPEVTAKLAQFGDYLGMAFQIRDDVLDFTGTSEALGKPAGSDLANGNITLPVMYALQDERLSVSVRQIHEYSTPREIQSVVQLIRNSDILDRADQLAEEYLQNAMKIVEELTEFPAHKDLGVLITYFGKRKM
ncbi:polyprenyl synthetase family protein [Brevibacillus laterosporus]|uniref:polyprenyl synthetase family protein n=1 Tax=Brevibacillus laterosporus TaxID=1465 RepID=UPI000E6D5868|nr:polyprenyl synthetase family protein [Brevibacillus laterosporus]AYB39414.1 polyprenyl synthetase family protein [Brevibacillus laterosporus]MBM7107977.1 Heptaprenyl diphosphate synthase component 2 [Brevibacillus laterosporus]